MTAITRILFVHGLESHPEGSKVVAMREAGYGVTSVDMFMSAMRLSRRNSFTRTLLRMPVVLVSFAAALTMLVLGFFYPIVFLLLFFFLIAFGVALRLRIFPAAIRASLEACISIQTDAIRTTDPEIVIGSSWGGAVVCEIARRGDWSGPVILLAPAYGKVFRNDDRYEQRLETLRKFSDTHPVTIFHDPDDPVVPFSDSEQLATDSKITLRPVEGGGHRLLSILGDGSLFESIET